MLHIPVSDRLVLRTYTTGDAPVLFNTIDKNRSSLRRWLAWVDRTVSPGQSLDFIRDAEARMQQQNGLALGIFLEDTLIGGIGMQEWDHELHKAEIGYWLDRERQGQGIMQRCAGAFIEYLFTRLQLNKIEIRFHPANHRSARVAERLGFKIEGILRDAQKRNGLLEDVAIAGLLRKEWLAMMRQAS